MTIKEKYNAFIPFIQKFNVWMFIIMAFSLPLYKPLISYVISLWLLSWLLELNFKKRFTSLKQNKFIFVISILFYCWHIFSLFYTTNMKQGVFDLQVKFSLLIFPLCCIGLNQLYKTNYYKILNAFVLGNIAASVVCIIGAFYHSFVFTDGHLHFHPGINGANVNASNFFYSNFSFFHHTSYFSMYLIFATVICCYFLFEKVEVTIKMKRLYIFSILFFTLMIFLLSSRAAFLTELVVICGLFLRYRSYIQTKYIRLTFVTFLIFCVAFIFMNPRFEMLKASYFSNEKDAVIKEIPIDVSTLSRIGIWKSAVPVLQNNALLGVGSGDVTNELVIYYEKNQNAFALSQKLNAHNQFIETSLGLGIVGILLLLALLCIPFYTGLKYQHYLLIFFLLITVVNYFFESMLNTQAGVIFFAFFFNFLIYTEQKKPTFSV